MQSAPTESPSPTPRSSSLRAGLLLAVFVAVFFSMRWISGTPIAAWQQRTLYWNYAGHLFLIAIPVLALILLRRPAADYGLRRGDRRDGLKLGLICGLPVAVLPILADAAMGQLTRQPRIAELWLNTILFQVVFVGFAEEWFFRGFLQSEWNRACGRPFRLWGMEFGSGLFVVALLFGAGHWLADWNPSRHGFPPHWPVMLFTTLIGLVLGFAREFTGSLTAPVVIHVAADIYPIQFVDRPAGKIALGVGWGICSALLITRASRTVDTADERPAA